MIIYPAIDLLGGRCVRLRQGDYNQVTVYNDDPLDMASQFAQAGASWIHIVDLDAARTGAPGQRRGHGRPIAPSRPGSAANRPPPPRPRQAAPPSPAPRGTVSDLAPGPLAAWCRLLSFRVAYIWLITPAHPAGK